MRAYVVAAMVVVLGMATACKRTAKLSDVARARQAWIEQARGFAAAPATIPRLSDPASAARFEALVSDPAWLTIDGATFAKDGERLAEVVPATKALLMTLLALHATDEAILLGLYMHDVEAALVAGCVAMVRALPTDDQTREARLEGAEQIRIAETMAVAGVLSTLPQASPAIAQRVFARLGDQRTFGQDSVTSLQLLLATIDETVLPALPATLRPQVESVRALVARRHDALAATSPPADRIYEGLTTWNTFAMRPVVSRGGGFAIDLGPGALVWSGKERGRGGLSTTVYELEWRAGAAIVDVTCRDDVDMDRLARSLVSGGQAERRGPAPGRWFTTSSDEARGGARITTIRGRVCIAGIEAPPGQLALAQIDATLATLRPAP